LFGVGILLYKVKSANFADFYLQRIYLVLSEIKWLLTLFVLLQVAFMFIFKIVDNSPANRDPKVSTVSGLSVLIESMDNFYFAGW
jgi:hypothetical protein